MSRKHQKNKVKENSKANEFVKERQALLDKYGLDAKRNLSFPMYKEYPVDLQLAIQVINSHKPIIIEYYEKKKK